MKNGGSQSKIVNGVKGKWLYLGGQYCGRTSSLSPALEPGRDSSVGIATRYGLDGPGIESRWRGEIFRTLGPTQPPIQWVPGSFS